MLSIALPPIVNQVLPIIKQLDTEQKLAIVREILTDNATNSETLSAENNATLAWEMGKDIFGDYHSGRSDLSQNAKALVKEKIRAKHG